jgi:O-antigen/teichoic acid export membrane protein
LRLGWPLGLATLGNQLLAGGDLLLVGAVLGSERAAMLFLAGALAGGGLVFANAANQWALARLARTASAPADAIGRLRRALGQSVALGTVVAALAAVAGPLLAPRLLGPAYAETGPLLLALAPWLLLQHPSAVLQGALAAQRRQRLILEGQLAGLLAAAAGLAAAILLDSLILVALTRAVAEAARLGWLLARLPELRRGAAAPAVPDAVAPLSA